MSTPAITSNTSTKSWSVTHPMTPEDAAIVAAMRPMLEPYKGQMQGTAAREPFDKVMGYVPAVDSVTYEPDTVAGVSGWWCHPLNARPAEAILYLHGGWYVFGSAYAYRNFVSHIAARAGVATFIPDYRLAPEHLCPAAVIDVQACYLGLIERGMRRIAIVGDSAGGGLGLVLLSLATKQPPSNGVVPVGAVALSPVTDMTLSGLSWETRAEADMYFTRPQGSALIHTYLSDRDPTDPLASPLYGDLTGLPPILIHVGNDELLLDDSCRYVERAIAAGVDAKVDVWEGMFHVFQASVGKLDAANQALNAIGAFLTERLTVAGV